MASFQFSTHKLVRCDNFFAAYPTLLPYPYPTYFLGIQRAVLVLRTEHRIDGSPPPPVKRSPIVFCRDPGALAAIVATLSTPRSLIIFTTVTVANRYVNIVLLREQKVIL